MTRKEVKTLIRSKTRNTLKVVEYLGCDTYLCENKIAYYQVMIDPKKAMIVRIDLDHKK